MMRVLSSADVDFVLTIDDCIEAVRAAMRLYSEGSGTVVVSRVGMVTEPSEYSRMAPPLPPDRVDAELLVALCAASLRVDVLRADVLQGDAGETTELALRRLPGVHAVVLEHDGDLTVCRLLASADAPDDVARQAAAALASEPRLIIELLRDPTTSPAPPGVAPSRSAAPADATAMRGRRVGPELLSVRSVPEDGEIEAHLALGQARAIGRAPLARGLAGAAEAVLAGVAEIDSESRWLASWIRTVETTASGDFVVAVALVTPETGSQRHGIAVGTSPIDAAARATVTALRDD
jgi:hypothetical protein